jgi:5-(carboxyamino)imidazole ribonucleotide mutase
MAHVTFITGSASDRPVIDPAIEILKRFGVSFEIHVASAHRDPERVLKIVREAESGGARIFIAAAGMAAHLAGMVAANTLKPVIGVPVSSGPLKGQDSLLSTVMMPPGVPVATVAVDGGKNAAWLALEILALLPDGDGIRKALEQERLNTRNSLLDAEKDWRKDVKP